MFTWQNYGQPWIIQKGGKPIPERTSPASHPDQLMCIICTCTPQWTDLQTMPQLWRWSKATMIWAAQCRTSSSSLRIQSSAYMYIYIYNTAFNTNILCKEYTQYMGWMSCMYRYMFLFPPRIYICPPPSSQKFDKIWLLQAMTSKCIATKFL